MGVKISIVTTMYYSESFVLPFYEAVIETLSAAKRPYELIFVNDGSPDAAAAKVIELQAKDANVVLVDLSRNFGHHQAILTGLSCTSGELIFLIDCDMEEHPRMMLQFLDVLDKDTSVDVAYGVQQKRKGGWFERISGNVFYWVLKSISRVEYPANTLTARLMRRPYVEAVLEFKEKALDVWAVFALAGFKQVPVIAEKSTKGTTTYTLRKKIRMAVEIITSLSHRPLYSIFFLGTIWLAISLFNVAFILVQKFAYGVSIEGWASIMASIWLIGGLIIFVLGVIAIYVSKIFVEIKNRPISIIKNIYRRN